MRGWWLAVLAGLGGCALASPTLPDASPGLQRAARNFPRMILGANTKTTSGPIPVRACPAAGGRVEQKGGPTMEYLGSVPGQPNLCRMRVGGDTVQGWYGIWLTDWPGWEQAYPALTRVMNGGTGALEGFDVQTGPDHSYHDLIRNEGVEHIKLLDRYYDAVKLAHYREGKDGNTYRSVSTIWKDLPTGLLVYGTYQHISGMPVIDDPLIPTAIIPAQ